MIAFFLMAAAAPAATTALDCHLITPGGASVAFLVSAGPGGGAAVAIPAQGTVWPAAPLAGTGAVALKNSLPEGQLAFAGPHRGVLVKIDRGRATLHVTRGRRETVPRAYGFCGAAADAPQPAGDAAVATDAVGDVPAFASASWSERGCALILRDGRTAGIRYELVQGSAAGGAQAVMAAPAGVLPAPSVVLRRGSGGSLTGDRLRLAADKGPSGYEMFLTDEGGAEAVKLLEFDRLGGSVTGDLPAGAICGYAKIVRRPAME
jgi:hypothetical protein